MKKTYKQITFFENKKRIDLLENFKLHLETYLNNLNHHNIAEVLSENVKSKKEYKEINKLIDKACSCIEVIPSIVGIIDENNYLKRELEIAQQNILHRSYSITSLLDKTRRAIKIYRRDSKKAKQRTYNPFFWILLLIDYFFFKVIWLLNKILPNKVGIEFLPISKLIRWMIRGIIFILVYLIGKMILSIIGNIVVIYLQTRGYVPIP